MDFFELCFQKVVLKYIFKFFLKEIPKSIVGVP